MASGNSAAASAAAAKVAPAAITGMVVRGRLAAQNGLRREAAAGGGRPAWLLNMRLFPSFASQKRRIARCCDDRYAGGRAWPVQFATLLSARRNLWRVGKDKSGYDACNRTPGMKP